MKKPANNPNSDDPIATDRAWDFLGHATTTSASTGFADRVLAASRREPQLHPARPWLAFVAPIAAAAILVFSLATSLITPAHRSGTTATAGASPADIVALAQMEATLDLLPDDPNIADIDTEILELASVDDPAKISDEQLLQLMY